MPRRLSGGHTAVVALVIALTAGFSVYSGLVNVKGEEIWIFMLHRGLDGSA